MTNPIALPKVQIPVYTGTMGAPRMIQLSVRDAAPIIAALNTPEIQKNTEEGLIATLLERFRGQIVEVERFNEHRRCNDTPTGQPGSRIYNEDGVMTLQRRYRDNMLQDSDDGQPAYLSYDGNRVLRLQQHYHKGEITPPKSGGPSSIAYAPDGSLQCEERCTGTQYQDGPNGEPAVILYEPEGWVRYVDHFTNGELNDNIHGEPASKEFNRAGLLVAATRFRQSAELGDLDEEEIAAYNRARRGGQQNPSPNQSGPRGPQP